MRVNVTISIFLFLFQLNAQSQQNEIIEDTFGTFHSMPEIIVNSGNKESDHELLPEIRGTEIYAGKKNQLLNLKQVQGNIATNNMRQILAKVPGIHIWDGDPSGIQVNIAARGLSPNRSWEFNIRQNGNDIAADPFGYPEAYYTPPMQVVKNIEIIRGQGALQYGPQFGGLVNFVLKDGLESSKKLDAEFQQTLGGNKLSSTFLGISATTKQNSIYAFFDQRIGDGWRQNSRYASRAGYINSARKKGNWTIKGNMLYAEILSQQPGGLPDSLIDKDARNSFRSRNWMKIKWFTPSFQLNYFWKEGKEWDLRLFGVIGHRNSIAFLKSINVPDSINQTTTLFNNRTLQMDSYRNTGMESRFITGFNCLNKKHRLSTGIRLFFGKTDRLADGLGSAGSDYDEYLIGAFKKDIDFSTINAAAFSELLFRINDRLVLIPGIRFEHISGSASGRNGWDSDGKPILLNETVRTRNFILSGISAEYHLDKRNEMYASFSQAYRPVQFSNLLAPPGLDVVDPNLRDAKGFNFDIGMRGNLKNRLIYDASFFMLDYNNRIGTMLVNENSSSYRLITNIGNSYSRGVELLMDGKLYHHKKNNKETEFNIFITYSYTHARYSTSVKDPSFSGKLVENVPKHILRAGFNWVVSRFNAGLQGSYTASVFSDAANTEKPNSSFQIGKIPAYYLIDFTMGYQFHGHYFGSAGINNLTDQRYFTRRSGGLPGPGAMPGDGISYFITIGKNF